MRVPKIGEIVLYRISINWYPAIVVKMKAPRLIDAVVFGFRGDEPAAMVFGVTRGDNHNQWRYTDDEEY